MDTNRLAQLLFPQVTQTPAELEALYPPRTLPEGARVTRMAPSPTGFLHIGALFGALTDERLAHRSGGTLYLRIEDTDAKREVPGAVENFIRIFDYFGIRFDEGAVIGGDRGAYGPYRQRERAGIYQVYAKKLVGEGHAYPCFCTEEELGAMRARQEAEKATPGYWGKWASCRNLTLPEIEQKLSRGVPYVIRLRSPGDPARRFRITDGVKGELELPENDQDIVLLKSDGIPTYHFAHAVDDHLMRTTHVVRGEEWLASLPVHVQLFELLCFEKPVWCHTATVMKLDGGSKRKLSKRKDPESDLAYFIAEGYPAASVREYVMTLLNSNFEEWRLANPGAPLADFPFSLEKMGTSGALFDLAKLRDVSRDVLARMTAEEVYALAADWAKAYAPDFHALLSRDPDYSRAILNIGRGGPKPRRDIAAFGELPAYMDFFFDETFAPAYEFPERAAGVQAARILADYAPLFDPADTQEAWFDKIRALSESLGYAPATKLYKKDPAAYRGHVGDVSMVLRVAVTGRTASPDLYDVMRLLGRGRVAARLLRAQKAAEHPAEA